ncbi:MAG: phosphohydrolase [Spirochaetaceae bacterium]|jgi:metal-dependent HD superfamily phosphatase/phosphodiesterase|nr:phosphohydrolase [Spirochaetaceae bacterium]
MRSPKEDGLDQKIIETISNLSPNDKALEMAKLLISDPEIQALQEYANDVSIKRLGFNDHGPVHMRIVALNAAIMLGFLREAHIKTSLEQEDAGSFDDSVTAVITAAFLHDAGMTISRQDHELHSAYIAMPLIDRLLQEVYHNDLARRIAIRAIAVEGIIGHMGGRQINSLEAGIVQIGDGCDMTKGRARISIALSTKPKVGDIHQYSANSIEKVSIRSGSKKPIRIDVDMSSEVGLFQVEEVLLAKIAKSTAKGYIELYAIVKDKEPKRYL